VAAHELRTPITAITGFASLLERETRQRNDPERIARFAHHVSDAGDRLALLVEDVLDVSRIRLGQLPLRLDAVDLCDLVARVLARYDDRLAHGHHWLHADLPKEPCFVPGDADRLEQVLVNLIENAIKYSPVGGTIEIGLVADAEGATINVQDEGIGLPRAELESIFLPFGRAGNALRSNVPGLGIGLYICRNIVERHGGRIWAESGGEGKGTRMSIWLPGRSPETADLLI
jgi:signal transduction histidine kinase